MVPIALYNLDYPKAPLLLVDFREPSRPKRHEAMRRGLDQLTTGILGLTTFGNLEYFAAKTTWTFVRRRHGAAVDRSARLRAYSQLRHSLFLDDSLDPRLRSDLLRRVDGLGLNPFEDGMETEARLAREQFAALRTYARSETGLTIKIEQARSNEIARRLHSKTMLALYRLASITTFRAYRHTERLTPELMADLDRQRRFAWHKRYLEEVIASTPQAEVTYNTGEVQRSLDAITTIGEESSEFRGPSEELVRRVLAQTSDADMRRRCYECLEKLGLQKHGSKTS
jgi:ribosomal protein S13